MTRLEDEMRGTVQPSGGRGVGRYVVTSDDAGAHWRLATVLPAAPPEPRLSNSPDASNLHIRIAGDAVRIGNPRRGWNVYDPTLRRLTQVWGERGAAHGLEQRASRDNGTGELDGERFTVAPRLTRRTRAAASRS